MEESAAHALNGRMLKTGWQVKEKIQKNGNQTGSFFSVCYIVEKNGEVCFLKAFDFGQFLKLNPHQDLIDVLNEMITAYRYERDLSDHCRNKHVTKVSFVKEAAQEQVPGYSIPTVPYLIFDLAEGDVRKRLDFSANLDYAWRFKSLHDVAVGLKQLHSIEVTHQDLKPSNILVFSSESKIGDLGRSICKNLDGPYNKAIFTGDNTYAPPEIWYKYYERDWMKRVYATDCYLLGSLIVFYFLGISMTALLRSHLPDEFAWENWRGDFQELVPYLENAFSNSLDEFENNIPNIHFKMELKELIGHLCNPFPEKRGHPKNSFNELTKYSMERFISKLDLLKRKAEYNLYAQ